MDKDYLTRIIEAAGYEPTAYSGRGMQGKECVGFITDDNLVTALAEIVECCDECNGAASIMRRARHDGMGRGIVIYWPRVAWSEEA